jgi:hypothetical protein
VQAISLSIYASVPPEPFFHASSVVTAIALERFAARRNDLLVSQESQRHRVEWVSAA